MLTKLARGVKNGALSLALKAFVNEKLSQYGEILDCQIDTAKGRVDIRALLRGETEAVSASIERYEIERIGDDRYIRINAVSCSREWIGLLLQRLFVGKQYKLPAAIGTLL